MNSQSEENYLKAVYHLSGETGKAVSTNSIAEVICTKASSVTDMLRKLAKKGLINYIKYQGVTLTDKGRNTAVDIVRRHRLWEVFLVEKLGFKWDEVHDIAEDLEHIESEILVTRLDEFLGFPKTDPHGDPIPDKNGKVKVAELVKTSIMKVGQSGVISGVSEHSSVFLQYLDKAGLTLGSKIKIKEILEYDGSVLLILNDKKDITISREAAKSILIAL
ncbi:metal-dependent transcriptional regulator [Pedobacter sp. HMF7647]|uniref:Transcriptional regulator MntR n=1 Tax=Hufsiella arboris TaxID=2695275 RepID=A0A7K1Y7X1_9SPHI|nr:metal-dependent transcriptional regulator [Hufsiella arboris]MXV50209.1 metal-dependent transcriptional regulator [Hufsiella arboris]